jgi:hypothetical protein
MSGRCCGTCVGARKHGSLGGTLFPPKPQERKGRLAESNASHMLRLRLCSIDLKTRAVLWKFSLPHTNKSTHNAMRGAVCHVLCYICETTKRLHNMDQLLRGGVSTEKMQVKRSDVDYLYTIAEVTGARPYIHIAHNGHAVAAGSNES